MKLNFRKLWTVLGSACVTANLAASAPTTTNQHTAKDDHSMVASGLMYAGPVLSEEATGIFLGADYVLWQVVQEGLETASSNFYATGGSSAQGSTLYPASSLLSGFKVHGGAVINECDNIDLFVQYTWLQRSTKTATWTGDSTTRALLPVDYSQATVINLAYPTNLSSGYRIAYNVLDFEIGRLTSLSMNSFAFRPFYGIRGVWNTNTWPVEYTLPSTQITYNLNNYQNTSGAGVRAGMDLYWKFFNNDEYFGGLQLIGLAAVSGVYGRTYVTTLGTSKGTASAVTDVNNKASLNRLLPIIDLSIGLSWDMSFGGEADNEYNVEIHALWETQSWIGYGRFLAAVPNGKSGENNGVQGLTVGASLMF